MAKPSGSSPVTGTTATTMSKKCTMELRFGGRRRATVAGRRDLPENLAGPVLALCDRCLTHLHSHTDLTDHLASCLGAPRGKLIYNTDKQRVYEIDGAQHKETSEVLMVLGMLYLGLKIPSDPADYHFYALLVSDVKNEWNFAGYFSKGKEADLYNLSCVLILPWHREKGYGTFLMELSYVFSKMEGRRSGPERPFSNQGKATYAYFWRNRILDFIVEHIPAISYISIDVLSYGTALLVEDIEMCAKIFGLKTYHRHILINWKTVTTHANRKRNNVIKVDLEKLNWTPWRTFDELTSFDFNMFLLSNVLTNCTRENDTCDRKYRKRKLTEESKPGKGSLHRQQLSISGV